jgi:transposase
MLFAGPLVIRNEDGWCENGGMARRIHLRPHLSVAELERRSRTAKEPNERTWWQLLWLLAQGCTAAELAAVTGYRAAWIGRIAKRYNDEGPAGMVNRRHTTSFRPPSVLAPALQEELRAVLAEALARNAPWTGSEVAAWMATKLGRPVSYHLGWSYLVRLRQRPQVPRPRHALADAEQQATVKKTSDRSRGRWRRRCRTQPSSCGPPTSTALA